MHKGTKDRKRRRSFLNLHIRVLAVCFITVALGKYIPWTTSQLFSDDTESPREIHPVCSGLSTQKIIIIKTKTNLCFEFHLNSSGLESLFHNYDDDSGKKKKIAGIALTINTDR